MIDENHSDWEWTNEEVDRENFGARSVYNMRNFADFLEGHYEVERNRSDLTQESLASVDVLIVKTPTEPYSAEERQRIEEFVAAGGGLWVIGDHTNVFGSSSIANELLKPFDVEFVHDSAYGLRLGDNSRWVAPAFGRHPIVESTDWIRFQSSCSIRAPLFCRSVIDGLRHSLRHGRLFRRDLFPESHYVLRESAPIRTLSPGSRAEPWRGPGLRLQR